MYVNVIVAVDGGEGGRDAAALGRRLAAPDARFTLVHVIATGIDLVASPPAEAGALGPHFARELELCGPHSRLTEIRAASPGDGIDQAAEEAAADLIVVGCSRRHGIGRLLWGDDVRAVLHRSARPLAIAPRGYAERPRPISRIGVAIDGEPPSVVAMAHASSLRAEVHGTLLPVSVVEPHYYPTGWAMVAVPLPEPEAELSAARSRLGELGGPELELLYGLTGEELVRFSERVDLLVCGSRHSGTLNRLILGSTSEYLTRHVYSPLLITPAVAAGAPRDGADRHAGVA